MVQVLSNLFNYLLVFNKMVVFGPKRSLRKFITWYLSNLYFQNEASNKVKNVYGQCTVRTKCERGQGSCFRNDNACKEGLVCSPIQHTGCNYDVELLPNVRCCVGTKYTIRIIIEA